MLGRPDLFRAVLMSGPGRVAPLAIYIGMLTERDTGAQLQLAVKRPTCLFFLYLLHACFCGEGEMGAD